MAGEQIGCWECESIWVSGKSCAPQERAADGERYDFHPEGYVVFENGGGAARLYRYETRDGGRTGVIRSGGLSGPGYDIEFEINGDRMKMHMEAIGGHFVFRRLSPCPRSLEGYPGLSEFAQDAFSNSYGQ